MPNIKDTTPENGACCDARELRKFERYVRKVVSEVNGPIHLGSHTFINAAEIFIKTAAHALCDCKLFIYCRVLCYPSFWQIIVETGKLSFKNRQILFTWSNNDNLRKAIYERGPLVIKSMGRENILKFAQKVNQTPVWVQAIETGTLDKADLLKLSRRKSGHYDYTISLKIIDTEELTKREVINLLKLASKHHILVVAKQFASKYDLGSDEKTAKTVEKIITEKHPDSPSIVQEFYTFLAPF